VSDTTEIGCQPGSVLGAGDDLRVLLQTRGGQFVLSELNPEESGGFERRLDKTSGLKMSATISGNLGDLCCEDFDQTRQWAVEARVMRDGRDAWVGPVTDIDYSYGKIEFLAADLTAWWDRRVLPTSRFTQVDLANIFKAYHDQALATDPSPNFIVDPTLIGILGDREISGGDYVYASDALSELSRTGIDWTAYGRRILVGGEEIPVDPQVVLSDEHFTEPPIVKARGSEQANVVIVKGKGVTGIARNQEHIDYYGELVRVFTEAEIEDQLSVNQSAQTRLDLLKDGLYVETGRASVLRTTAPVTLPELIPGIVVRVRAEGTCRKVTQDFRLESVDVGFGGQVSIKFQPIGTVDSTLRSGVLS